LKTFYLAYGFSDLLQVLYLVIRRKRLFSHPLQIIMHTYCSVQWRDRGRGRERDLF